MTTTNRTSRKAPASCAGCFAWGLLRPMGLCQACYEFGRRNDPGECAGCRRVVPLKKGYCRLCWRQASLEAAGEVTVLAPYLARLRHHQLFLADMRRAVRRRGHPPRRSYKSAPPPPTPRPFPVAVQLRLFQPSPRDLHGFDWARHADLTNPWLARARQVAAGLAEGRGWTRWVTSDVDRALVILLSGHAHGDQIRYAELFPALQPRGLSIERTAEVLTHLGLLDDDRTPSFERWLERKLTGLAPGIAREVEAWLRTLHDGGPRTRARDLGTVWSYLNFILPVLLDWSARYDHLREVTRNDVLAARDAAHGGQRHNRMTALRSLFRFCKQTGVVFANPTSRVPVGQTPCGTILPLQSAEIRQAIAAATTPATRLILALAAAHAARPKAIRHLRLTDVDLGNQRLTIAGRVRPLDDLTHRAVGDWLDERRTRWPNTANPYLLVTQHTAMDDRPVGRYWVTDAVRGLTATLERLRVDRQLEEALAHGPDPLHLAVVFGLDEHTAVRYATAARELLESSAERYAAEGSAGTQGSAPTIGPNGPLGSR